MPPPRQTATKPEPKRWRFVLAGEAASLESLAKTFSIGDPLVTLQNGSTYLHSAEWLARPFEEWPVIAEEGWQLTKLINGAMMLADPRHIPVSIAVLEIVESDGNGRKVTGWGRVVERKPFASEWARELTLPALRPTTTGLAKALRLYSAEQGSWSDMFKVWEVIREDAGRTKFATWASKPAISRFTGTANSYLAVGDNARHAKVKGQKLPADRMSFGEAHQFIEDLLLKWVEAEGHSARPLA